MDYETGDCYQRGYYTATSATLPSSSMPALVLPPPHNHLNTRYPAVYNQQGLSTAYGHHTQQLTAVPSGYNPNSTHQYPRRPPPAQDAPSKPLRPAERMRLRPWLIMKLEERSIPGLEWENREEQTVKIPWKHAARHGWVKDRDASLFKAWAIHTKKYNQATDTPKANPKMWKANFRCAINSLPDIEELRDRGKTKGNDAYKVYRLIPRTKGATKRKLVDYNRSKKSKKPRLSPMKPNKPLTIDTKSSSIVSEATPSSAGQSNNKSPLRIKSELTISAVSESHFHSPLSSPASVTSSQPSTPLSAPPINTFRTAQQQQWLTATVDQNYIYQQNMEPYQNGVNDHDDYLSNASGSDLTDEEIVDMVDEMIQDSPINSPTRTVPSSPLYDSNNNTPHWAEHERLPYAHPLLGHTLPSNMATYLCADYHSSQVGVVKVEPQGEGCDSHTAEYHPDHRGAPPSYQDAVARRAECIKEEPSPTYHSL